MVEPAPAQGYRQKDDDAVIKVHGVDDVMVYRAKCCNPIKGEGIVGYVTRGKGIAVHSRTCPNVQNLMYDSERKIEVDWARNASDSFPVRIVVHTDDRPGLLHQLTSVLSDENTNVRSLEAKTDVSGNDAALVEMTVDVRDKKQLEKLCSAMRRISGVRDVERLVNSVAINDHSATPTPNTSRSRNRKASRSIGKTGITARTASSICATGAPAPPAPARMAPSRGRRRPQRQQPASPFQMYKPKERMVSIEPVGNYALRIVWSDGHNTGIYSYDHLRQHLPLSGVPRRNRRRSEDSMSQENSGRRG